MFITLGDQTMGIKLFLSLIICIFCITGIIYAEDNRALTIKSMQSEKRVALVIGNGEYTISPLKNPVNDAEEMVKVLEELNFEVISGVNLNQKEMKKLVILFGNKIKNGGAGLFYFAGHGVQVNGRNYLIPVNAVIETEEDVDIEAIDVGLALSKMEGANNRLNIVILDACRNNPFARSYRSSASGLAQMKAPKGSFISYATAPGSVASDGNGKNGLFTQELIKNMKIPGMKIEEMFKVVRGSVQAKSNQRQVPWESSSLTGDFYFKLDTNTNISVPTVSNSVESAKSQGSKSYSPDVEYWEKIKNSSDVSDFKEFISIFPDSLLAPVAKITIKQLDTKQMPQHTETVIAASPAIPSKAINYKDTITGLEMIFVKGKGNINDFYIGKYEVTQGQWIKVMGSNPSNFVSCGDDCPVEQVSWNDTQEFIKKVNKLTNRTYRLPTEQEWEYACRSAGKNETYSGGENVDKVAWYIKNSEMKPHQADTKSPNGLGIYDMSGNVWELTQDNNDSSDNDKVIRGGSWEFKSEHSRCNIHSSVEPDDNANFIGFRIARSR